jgi:hypothetical protein
VPPGAPVTAGPATHPVARDPRRPWRHAVLVAACAVSLSWCLLGGEGGLLGGAPAGAAVAAAGFRPRVVQVRRVDVPGPGGRGVAGPVHISASLPRPTDAGSLLVAAVIDGVRTSGMRQPSWHLPGWRRAGDVIGGNTADGGRGGPVYYRPDAPAGVTSVPIGTVPRGTVADVTVVVAELSGVSRRLVLAGTAGSSSGPTPATDTTASSVALRLPGDRRPALVLAAFTNGGTAPHGERWVRPRRWRVVGQDRSLGGVDQPALFDETVWGSTASPHETVHYVGGRPVDNCAVMVALA